MPLFDDLTARGLLEQVSDPAVAELLAGPPLVVYAGFDPTAPSLHVGSLMPILGLARLQRAGHRPIAVVGGATGMIGDPSGKTEERKLLSVEDLDRNVAGLRAQLARFLDFSPGGAELVNNYDWFRDLGYLEFLRAVGKHFSVNMMLGKESVRARLEDREHGISYTEFSYMLLQAYDFLRLYDDRGCTLQIGGSDQWGNITAGIDLIRRTRGKPAYGFTLPLITTADGRKFGKTESGNVWLDAGRTSPYEMYQFFLNTDDRDVARLLRFFTFLPVGEIEALVERSSKDAARREAQRVLGFEVTKLVHGEEEARKAEAATAALFRPRPAAPKGELAASAPERARLPRDDPRFQEVVARVAGAAAAGAVAAVRGRGELAAPGLPLTTLLADPSVGLAKSASEARRKIGERAVYVNEALAPDVKDRVTEEDLVEGRYVLLRRGKADYRLVRFD